MRIKSCGAQTRFSGKPRRFCTGGARPPTEVRFAFIGEHRERYGVESICRVLPIAQSTYDEQEACRKDPSRGAPRRQRDAELCAQIDRVWRENRCLDGARKVWKQLKREGFAVARCTVELLMAGLGL